MRPNFRGRGFRPQKRNPNRINGEIRVPEVRVIADGVEPKVYSIEDDI